MSFFPPIVRTFLGGEVVTNQADAGNVSTHRFTVPANKKWLLMYAYAERDTSATFDAEILDTADAHIGRLCDQVSAGTTNIDLPRDALWPNIIVLDSGFDVLFTWGAAQTSPLVALVVLEIVDD